MFCENCGKPNPDGALFCEECGTRIAAEAAPVAPAAPVATAAPAKKFTVAGLIEKAKAIHQKNKLIFPIAGAVVVIAIALAIVFSILGKQVSMKNYLKITMEGYDGYGSMSYDFGDVSFGLRAAGDKDCKEFGDGYDDEYFLEYDRDDVSKDYRDNLKKAQQLVASIEIEYKLPEGKTNNNLSNGDVITFIIKIDEKVAEKLDLTIKDTTFEYTVEGLKPLAKFDVLSYFDLVFEGYDGYGSVMLECNQSGSKQAGNITFEMEAGESYIRWTSKDGYDGSIWASIESNHYNLSNGDTVKLAAGASADYLISDGVELIGLEKECAVSGLKESTKVDLLQYYTILYRGVNGSGTASVVPAQETVTIGDYEVELATGVWRKDGDTVAYTSVFLEKSYNLTNGDETELYISYSEASLASIGIKITEPRKKITVATLGDYVKTLSEIKDYTAYEEAARKSVVEFLEKSWSVAVHNNWLGSYSNQAIGEVELYKMVLATPNDLGYEHNDLWMVYKITVSDNEITTPTAYYFTVSQDNVIVNTEGTLILNNEYFGTYSGRTSYDKLYTDQIDYYSYGMNIEVSK